MTAYRDTLPRLTDRLPLGASGLEVSPFALGIVGDPATIPAAYEAGINFFFLTADMHWPLYEPTRRGLAMLLEAQPSARDHLVIAVTAYVTQPEFLWLPFEEVRMELPSIERIDLTIAGGSYGDEIDRRLETFRSHRTSGFAGTRAIGSTFHDRAAARKILGEDVLDIAFVRFNPMHPGAREDIFPHVTPRADGRKALLYNFKSTVGFLRDEDAYTQLKIGADFWRPDITDYYRFALTHAALDGVLCSLPSPAAVRELADALARGPLDDEDRQYLLDLGELSRGKARVAP